jgi:hypothetical protein
MKASQRLQTEGGIAMLMALKIRQADPMDEAAIARLAQLDSAEAPTGELLVAENGEDLVAALPLGGGRPVADPFRRTAEAVELLRLRARQLRHS